MEVVDSFNFENKLRVEGGVRDVRIQHQFRVFVYLFGADMKDYRCNYIPVLSSSETW
jgi:hypothetical protein